jgi:acyl-coenzyme A thioesterase PaaI-like protein
MTDSQLIAHYTSLGWETYTEEGFMQVAGPFFFKVDGPNMHFLFPTGQKHKNLRSVVQGGALMTFTDRSFGAFARHATGSKATATIQFNYNFVDAVQLGEVVTLSPIVTKSTKSMIFINGELTVGDRPVGFCTGIWKRFD